MIERVIEKTILKNGLTVVSETIEHTFSVSSGIWVRAGSRHEEARLNGITHFIEHALFKGTKKRSAHQIAVESDILGGNLDAFTTREFTGYHIKALDYHLTQSFDIIADLVTAPVFDSEEVEKERAVILEEIKMVDDTPDEIVHELFSSIFWPDHPLGRPIEGTIETVQSFKRDELIEYYRKVYQPKNIVISAAGNVKHSQLIELAEKYFGDMQSLYPIPEESAPNIRADKVFRTKRGLEQTHIVIGAPCPSLVSADRYACSLFNTILGGGFSSRLFQSVRERNGLAYNVYSSVNAFCDVGCLSVYMAVSNDQVRKALELAMQEIKLIKEERISDDELQAVKEQYKAAILLNLDSITGRMGSLAQNEITYGRDFSIEELITSIEQVTADDIRRMGNEIFESAKVGIVTLGGGRTKLDRKILDC